MAGCSDNRLDMLLSHYDTVYIVTYHVAAKSVPYCWTSDTWWNSRSQFWSQSFRLWHRRLCSGNGSFRVTYAYLLFWCLSCLFIYVS